MEQLQHMTGVMCILIMIVGIIKEVGSFSSTEKLIKLVASVYIIVAFFKVINNSQLELSFNIDNKENLQIYNTEQLKSDVMREAEIRLEQIVKNRLDEKNISYNSLSVHILEQNSNVVIEKIVIDCDSIYLNAVEECLYDLTSGNTKIITGE